MIRVRNTAFPTAFFQPLMSPELAWSQESRNGIIQPVDSTSPYVTLRFPDTRSGTFEFLFPDRASMELARGILNQPARFLYENTDATTDAIRTNVLIDPEATDPLRWSSNHGADGSAGTETMVTGAGDGPVLPNGAQLSTYARFTWTTPPSGGGTWYVEYNDTALAAGSGVEIPSFSAVDFGLYIRSSVARGGRPRAYGENAAGSIAWTSDASGASLRALEADTWHRVGYGDFTDAEALFLRIVRVYASQAESPITAGDTIDITASIFETGAGGPWFSGNNSAPGGSAFWVGDQDASPSVWVPDGAERFEFVTVGNIEARRNMPYRSWMLRVPFREVV